MTIYEATITVEHGTRQYVIASGMPEFIKRIREVCAIARASTKGVKP